MGVGNVTFTYVGKNNLTQSILTISKEQLAGIADNRVIPGASDAVNSLVMKQYTPEQLSNAMNHRDAISMISSSPSPAPCMSIVLEDDVQFCEGFDTSFKSLVQLLREDTTEKLGYVHLGHIAHTRVLESEADFIPSNGLTVVNSCEAYFITQPMAVRLVAKFYPIRFVTHIHLAHILSSCGQIMHLYNRRTFKDGSKCGVFSSTISENNTHVYDEAFMSVKQAIASGVDEEQAANLLAGIVETDVRFSMNPDYIILRAMLMEKTGDAIGAAGEMKRAMSEHSLMGSNITKRSQFLLKYIDICRILAVQKTVL
jgi:GR25 family glycosyltransferase involved in LPS biosynthesis